MVLKKVTFHFFLQFVLNEAIDEINEFLWWMVLSTVFIFAR